MSNELPWQTGNQETVGYGQRLSTETGKTILYLRYNTGLHISLNGRAFAILLDELSARYPEIRSITLIGHSMGGLVIRSAGYYGAKLNHQWTLKLRHVVLLGTPASGAPLEKISHLAAAILRRIPNLSTKIVAKVINTRSDGIRDLRLGFMVDEDWQHPRSGSVLFNLRTPIEPLPYTNYHVFIGTISGNENSYLASFFGDGMVSKFSAQGGSIFAARDPLRIVGDYKFFPKTNHLKIIFSEEVFRAIRNAIDLE